MQSQSLLARVWRPRCQDTCVSWSASPVAAGVAHSSLEARQSLAECEALRLCHRAKHLAGDRRSAHGKLACPDHQRRPTTSSANGSLMSFPNAAYCSKIHTPSKAPSWSPVKIFHAPLCSTTSAIATTHGAYRGGTHLTRSAAENLSASGSFASTKAAPSASAVFIARSCGCKSATSHTRSGGRLTSAPCSSGFGNATVGKSGSGCACSLTTQKLDSGKPNDLNAWVAAGKPTPCIAVYAKRNGDLALSLRRVCQLLLIRDACISFLTSCGCRDLPPCRSRPAGPRCPQESR